MSKILQYQDLNMGEVLKRYRNKKGYSQIKVASEMQLYGSNMSSATYSKIERGERNIFVNDFITLKLVLDFEYDDFFKEFENIIISRKS